MSKVHMTHVLSLCALGLVFLNVILPHLHFSGVVERSWSWVFCFLFYYQSHMIGLAKY